VHPTRQRASTQLPRRAGRRHLVVGHLVVGRLVVACVTVAVVVLASLVGAASVAGPSSAQTFERITRYDTDLTVETDGGLLVKETIDYDFGASPRHGIFREIPVRVNYEPKDNYDRVFPVDVLSVTASGGASAQYETEEAGDDLRIRIGDPDATVTGAHTYEITYRVRGAYTGFEDHDELVWNVVGSEWLVTVETATSTVHVPGDIMAVNCAAGPYGSNLPCGSATFSGGTATFTAPQLGIFPFQAMTVSVAFPKGIVPPPKPILEERFNIASAFRTTTATTSISGAMLLLILGAVGALLYFVGRDRRYRGSSVDAAFGAASTETAGTPDERVPVSGEDETPVEFVPPDGLRPGQLGTLVDFVANPLDVTATIVDLAVRGYLVIEETEESGLFRKGDWSLTQTEQGIAAERGDSDGGGGSGGAGLLPYERTLLEGLFKDGTQVQLSSLHNTFATRMQKVQTALMNDAMQRKWFAGKPGVAKGLGIAAGIVVLVIGIAVTVLLAAFTHAALVGLPIVLGGIVLIVGAHWMPHRTAKGYAVLRRTEGFRRFIDESEKERARFAERVNLFSEYLPYAIVFGATKKWANAFAGLDGEAPDTSTWYRGQHAFTYIGLTSAIDSFSVSSAGTLTSSPSSSGSGASGFSGGGFSGGGGGGGGGGSW
jgi:uncharacterized membrane protein YgcG